VGGNRIHVYDAAGTSIGTSTFAANVPSGANQATILVATTQAASFFGVTPDLTLGSALPRSGGQVCYEDVDDATAGFIDCVAWGNFTGASPSPTGNPFGPVNGIPDGRSILRDISAGNPGLLETGPGGGPGGDDTDDSAADFDAEFPTPRNNAGGTTTTAGTASVDGSGELDFVPAAGVKNKVTVADSGGGFWRLTDTAAPVLAGAGCERLTVNRVRCAQAAVTRLSIAGGDLNDQLTTPDGIPVTLDGGAGDDILTAKNGADTLLGGLGRDILDGGFGPDSLDGGDNQDTVTYERRTSTQGVVVDIGGAAANDGGTLDDVAGVRDTVFANVENLKGGAGEDSLVGSNGPNKITGGAGEDDLHGGFGNDEIRANDAFSDSIQCGGGPADHVFVNGTDTFPTTGPDACELVN
jgi:Ca2+-binding RTX toxin-like protein